MNHYDTLGITPDAAPDAIRKAYRTAAGKYHPDRDGGDAERMAAVNQAYAVLMDPEQRALYDDPLTAEALQALEQLFASALDRGTDDPLTACRRQLFDARAQLTMTLGHMRGKTSSLSSKRSSVKAKAGFDLFAAVLERRIAAAEVEMMQLSHHLKVNARIGQLLENYEAGGVTAGWLSQ